MMSLTEPVNVIKVINIPEVLGQSITDSYTAPEFIGKIDVLWPIVRINGHAIEGHSFNLKGDLVSTDPDIRKAEAIRKSTQEDFDVISGTLGGLFNEKWT
jgi:hypothetical protein